MNLNPDFNSEFDALLMSDQREPGEVDNSSTVHDNADEVESHSTDAGSDKEAEDALEASPEESGEQADDAPPAAPEEPIADDGDRFKDGSGKTEAGKAHREAERELGRKSNELAAIRSRLEQREAELASLNQQAQARRYADPSGLTPESYAAAEAEAQREGFDSVEDYYAAQRTANLVKRELGATLGTQNRSLAYQQAQAFSGTLPDMDKVGSRVVEILEETGAIEAVPFYLDAPGQAQQMQQAIKAAHLQAHNEYLQAQIPKIRQAEKQRAERDAAARRANKQSSSVAGSKGAVPSPGAAPERSPADAVFGTSGSWFDRIK